MHTQTHIYSLLVLLQCPTHPRELPYPCRGFLVVVLRQIPLKLSMLLAQLLCSPKQTARKTPEGNILGTWTWDYRISISCWICNGSNYGPTSGLKAKFTSRPDGLAKCAGVANIGCWPEEHDKLYRLEAFFGLR